MMNTSAELFEQALRFHQSGDLTQAEPIYRQILQIEPSHADAHHLLGVLAHQTGRHEEAAALIGRAIVLEPLAAGYHFNLANVRKVQGQFQEAVQCYREALRLNPQMLEALVNLAGVLREQGQLAEAVGCYRQALDIQPRHPGLLNNLGLLLKDLGQLSEAITCYRQAWRLAPAYADVLDNLGMAYKVQGNLTEAAECCREALRINPQHPQAHNSLGIILQETGKLDQAMECYRQALHINPQNAGAHHNLGTAYWKQGRFAEASECFRQALRIQPQYALAYCNLGHVLKEQGQLAEAIECFRQATRLNPQDAALHLSLGNALLEQGEYAEAAQSLQQALRINPRLANVHLQLAEALRKLQPPRNEPPPDHLETPTDLIRQADSQNNLGQDLMDEGKAAEAAQCFRHALSINPRHADAHNNLCNAHLRLGQIKEAWEHNEQALRINPVHGSALWDRSLLRLLQGDFLGGWSDYEQRWALPNVRPRIFPRPRWDGSPLAGKTILLHSEQGLGDTIQFVRYVTLVKECGGNILLGCQPPLASLMARIPEISTILRVGAPLPPYDVHAPLLSLPGILGTTVDTIPTPVPYLNADPARLEYWRQEVGQLPGLKIGIAWQGNPKNQIDRYRSLPLANFEPLARLSGITLVSLQVGHGTEQLDEVPFPVINLGSRFDPSSLEDLAAAIMNMDLMVTSDSAVAHLAGALGAPILTALGLSSDWRWLLKRSDSPWYPTMRLFRQQLPGEWGEVFQRIAGDLEKYKR